ncbi:MULTISPECIES: helix-turn-helix domain-containing protein [Niastella]|uniref:Helix-turn-helix transcriptional regulator n=1 Tax=Niastella soli TaxID=2821487 RepID=A0ABS3Z341_9BACT|nr:helix-turn-helix transcriptional regulator [Niastella soli]MBO9204448.1 helix-turn-helix transcriptional regulator [Niastella soli]
MLILLDKLQLTSAVSIVRNTEELLPVFEQDPFQVIAFVALQSADGFMERLHACIFENLHNKKLNVDMLARYMNMSRPTLYRKIKQETDHTPNEMITLARLKQASTLLLLTDHKVFEVAEMVGFHSSSSFGKAFLKRFHVTPAAYQRINKKQDLI